MAKGFPVKPKKQKKEIVGITPSEPTFGGVRGKPTGPTAFFEQDPIRPVSVSEKGIVQDIAGGTAPQDISQLEPEQKVQLGIGKPPIDVKAISSRLKGISGLGEQQPSLPPQIPATGQISPVAAQMPVDREMLKQIEESKKGIAPITPEDVLLFSGLGGLTKGVGSKVLGAASGKIAAKTALNIQPEAAHFIKTYAGKASAGILRGGAPEAGKLAVNTKTAGLVAQIARSAWGKLGITLAGLSIINQILDNGFNGTRYLNTVEEVKKAIRENNVAIEKEAVPQIRQAFMEEQEMLLKLEDEITNLDGWEAFLKNIPLVDNAAAKSVIAKGKRGLSESEDRKARLLLEKFALEQANANVIRNLPPDVREALIEYSKELKESESLAKELIGGIQ